MSDKNRLTRFAEWRSRNLRWSLRIRHEPCPFPNFEILAIPLHSPWLYYMRLVRVCLVVDAR
jgi:hypothetical protein